MFWHASVVMNPGDFGAQNMKYYMWDLQEQSITIATEHKTLLTYRDI